MENRKNNFLWIFLHIHKTGGTTFNAHLAKELGKRFIHLDSREEQKKFNKLSKKQKKQIKVLVGHETYYGIHKLFPEKEPRYVTFLRDSAERLVSQYNHYMSQEEPKNRISFDEWYEKYPKNEMTRFFNRRFKGTGKKIQRATLSLKILKYLNKLNFWPKFVNELKNLQIKTNSEKKEVENAKKLLSKCRYVGITENLDTDLKFLFNEIGVPTKWRNMRVTGKEQTWKNKFVGKNSKKINKLFKLDEGTRKKIYKDNLLDVELYEYAKKLNRKI